MEAESVIRIPGQYVTCFNLVRWLESVKAEVV